MNNETEKFQMKQMVPELRFPEFEGDWNEISINNSSKTVTSGSRDWAQFYSESGAKFIRMTNLNREGISLLLDDTRYVSLPKKGADGKRTSLQTGDILISITAELGKIGLIPNTLGEAYINQHTALVRPDENFLIPHFLAYKLSTNKANIKLNRLNDSGAKAGLNLSTIRKFKFFKPCKKEQQKIASFLTAIDQRITLLKEKKAALEDYKKGLMQKIFSQEIRFDVNGITNAAGAGSAGAAEDDEGNGFVDWEERMLGDICDVKGGKRIPKGYSLENENNGFPYITVSDMFNGSVSLNDIRFVPKEVFEKIKNYRIFTNEIYISVAGTLGLVGVIPNELDGANLTENANKLTNIKCIQEYLFHYLNSDYFKKLIWSVRTTNAQPKLAIYALKSFVVKLPSQKEQQKIANFLSSIDQKINAMDRQITDSELFKKGLLQRMFV